MKRVLWVTAIAPCFDAGGGGEIRQAHLIEALTGRFDVELLLAGRLRDQRVRSMLHAVTEVPVSISADPPGAMRRRLRDIRWEVLERRPDEVARHEPVRQALGPRLGSGREADIVCVEYVGLAPLLPAHRSGVWALTLHNLPSQMARHSASVAPGTRQRIMQRLKERNAREVERWAAGAYDLVVAVSAEDAAVLPGSVAVVPNGVDTARFRPGPLPDSPRVVFTGALHTLPNRDGIRWFATEVWGAVRARVPDATLDVVGARPPAEILELGALEGIQVHPDVADVAPFLERARVAVVPLRIGSGSRLKALEAMAAGLPVVGTSIGLGGLELEPGRDALAADDPGRFSDAVARCLTDSELSSALASRGLALVESRYSWERIGADYASLLESCAGSGTSSPAISAETVATNSSPIRSQPNRSST